MPKPSKPTIELAVAGQKAKASTYNDNFQTMLDYVDECMDYAVLADLSNLDATGEAHFLRPNIGVRRNNGSSAGSLNRPIYVTSDGVATACSGLDSNMRCNSRTSITETKGDWVIAQGGSGTSGYRVWSSGFKECWGQSSVTSNTSNVAVTISMGSYSFSSVPTIITAECGAVAFSTNTQNYMWNRDCAHFGGTINRATTNSFYFSYSGGNAYKNWYAFGY